MQYLYQGPILPVFSSDGVPEWDNEMLWVLHLVKNGYPWVSLTSLAIFDAHSY